jgi:ribosomal protein L11 methyltransferase
MEYSSCGIFHRVFLLIIGDKLKQFKEFIIKANPFNPDIISGFLWDLNISGLNEEQDSLLIYTDNINEIKKEDVNKILQNMLDNKIINSFEVEEKIIEDKNWNLEWEKGINVVEVSDNIVIKPSFKNYDNKKNKIVITIDPKMSFGTGGHETTRLVIQLLEKYIKKGVRVFDIGTGTGILAIAAVKLGAKSVLAIDNDEWCFSNAEENSRLNDVADKVEIKLSEINQVEENNFDLILANIQKNVVLEICEEVKNKLSKGGIVILSGLLIEDEKDIAERYKELKMIDLKIIGEWLALVFQKI